MKWELEEALLLIDLFNYIKTHDKEENEIAIQNLSSLLVGRARELGYRVDEKFCNITEIKIKLQNIEYLQSNGAYGFSSYSALDERAYRLSMERPKEFMQRVKEMKAKYNVLEDNTICNIITREPELLCLSENDMTNLRGSGAKCLKEVKEYCTSSKTVKDNYQNFEIGNKTKIPFVALNNKANILRGHFSFITKTTLNDDEIRILERYKEGYNLLDNELIAACREAPEKIFPILIMLYRYIDDEKKLQSKRTALFEAMNAVPASRHITYAIGYIQAFSEKESIRHELQRLCETQYTFLKDIINKNSYLEMEYRNTLAFIKWCAFDIDKEIEELFIRLFRKEKMKITIELRARNNTLEAVGKELNITRERVRQIESKAKAMFASWYSESRLLSKIVAIRNGDTVLTPVKLEKYFGKYAAALLYLLRSLDGQSYAYDSQLDVFIVDNPKLLDRVQNYVEALPDLFNENKLKAILSDAENKGILKEILERAIFDEYKLTGRTYHRVRLSLARVYSIILQRYYQEGIKAYDDAELEAFRQHVLNDFGNLKLPRNNRALTVRITSVCILCGRGIYRPREGTKIPKELAAKICNYIENSKIVIFLTNTLFSIFEDELIAAGINNKYYLQGILHELYGDKFIFRRDYISKDESVTSVYMDIVQYIKGFDYPMSKKQLQNAYLGVTDIVFSFAVSDPSILNYFGKYLHVSRLKISENERIYLHNVIDKMAAVTGYFHCKEIYEYINSDDPILLKRLFILHAFSLFSVLEYLFREEYQFLRPFIAKPEINIEHAAERLNELIKGSEEVLMADIGEFSRENHFQIQSILEYVNSHNDTHLLKNETTIATIESLGVNEACAVFIEHEIIQEIMCTMTISQLNCIHRFPKINAPWTEWLVYSVLKKWSTKLEVATTNNHFRMSAPVVALRGQLDMDIVSNTKELGKVVNADNLDEIDSLISEFIEDEIGDLASYDF